MRSVPAAPEMCVYIAVVVVVVVVVIGNLATTHTLNCNVKTR
jgi:hypothetical protein